MATLANITINDTGFLTVPSGTTAQRPSTPTVTTSTLRPIGISANGLRLFIPGFWTTYQNLPAYLTGLPTTTFINNTDSGTFTINFAARVYLLRDPTWSAVDLTGWTLVESGKNYGISTNTSVYFKDFSAGTYAYDDLSAMYMWDFGTNAAARNGQMYYNTSSQVLETYRPNGWADLPVTNGLVCYLDAGRFDSYPGYGPVIKDLSGSGRNGLLIGSWSWSDIYGGVIQLNASTGWIRVPDINLVSGQYTVMGATRYTGASRGRIISSLSNNWLLGHWNATTANYYAEGWVSGAGVGTNDTNWRIYTGTGDSAADSWAFYVNNVLNAGPNNGGSAGPNGLSIGASAGASEWSDGQFGFVVCYNRILSAAEMTQNYNYFKDRYGL